MPKATQIELVVRNLNSLYEVTNLNPITIDIPKRALTQR